MYTYTAVCQLAGPGHGVDGGVEVLPVVVEHVQDEAVERHPHLRSQHSGQCHHWSHGIMGRRFPDGGLLRYKK